MLLTLFCKNIVRESRNWNFVMPDPDQSVRFGDYRREVELKRLIADDRSSLTAVGRPAMTKQVNYRAEPCRFAQVMRAIFCALGFPVDSAARFWENGLDWRRRLQNLMQNWNWD